MKKHLNKNIIGFFSLLFILIMFSNHTLANNDFDDNKDISLTIDLKHEGIILPNVDFNLYKIASVDKEGISSLEEDFQKYPIDFENLDTSGWNDHALTLKSYIVKDEIQAIYQGKTNESGVFNTNVKPGLYLIIGNQTSLGNYTYRINPYFLMLPAYDREINEWNYDLTSYPKTLKEEEGITSKKIIKVWNDSGYENKRPESIEVEVFANENSYEIVSLSKENNWKHTLLDLDSTLDWTVMERDIKRGNYKVKVREEGDAFIVENTYIGKKPIEKPSQRPKELPNTGQLWWPIFTLIILGIVFVVLGLFIDKKKELK